MPISGQPFVLPVSAKLFMKAGRESTKNEIEFRSYRKFEADTFIKYDLDPNAPPIPDTTEQKPLNPEPEKPDPPTEQKPAPKKDSPWVLPTPRPSATASSIAFKACVSRALERLLSVHRRPHAQFGRGRTPAREHAFGNITCKD